MDKAIKVFKTLLRRTKQLPRNINRLSKLNPKYKSRMEDLSFLKAKVTAINNGKVSKNFLDVYNEANIKLKNTPKKAKVLVKEIAMGSALPAAGAATLAMTSKKLLGNNNNE